MYASRLKAVISSGMFCMPCCVGTFAGFAYVLLQMCIRAETDHTLWLQNTGPTISPCGLHLCFSACVQEQELIFYEKHGQWVILLWDVTVCVLIYFLPSFNEKSSRHSNSFTAAQSPFHNWPKIGRYFVFKISDIAFMCLPIPQSVRQSAKQGPI